jgi:hypothetical protein
MDLREVEYRGKFISTNRHPWEVARVEVVKRKLSEYINELSGKVILDIGCGDTFVVEALSKFLPDTDFFAIDIAFSDELILNYNKKLKHTSILLFKTLDDALGMLENRNVGCVLLLDVIEHIEDDIAFLKDLHSKSQITEDVKLLITVPAFQMFFTSHDTFLGHYRRYTNKNLERNINISGFESIELGYFFTSLILVRFLQLLKEKFIKPSADAKSGLVGWSGGKMKSLLLKKALLFDFYFANFFRFFGINIIGLSNYVVCKKFA